MKRIVQCPKCQAKLSVFDFGKPINQKCPKCSENFVIESIEKKDAATSSPEPDAPATAPESTPVKQPADTKDKEPAQKNGEPKTAPASEPAAVVPAPAITPLAPAAPTSTDAPKESLPKKSKDLPTPSSSPRPAAKPAASALPEHDDMPMSHCGVSFLHLVTIIGLLVLSLIVQVISKRQADKNYVDLANRISRIEAALKANK